MVFKSTLLASYTGSAHVIFGRTIALKRDDLSLPAFIHLFLVILKRTNTYLFLEAFP